MNPDGRPLVERTCFRLVNALAFPINSVETARPLLRQPELADAEALMGIFWDPEVVDTSTRSPARDSESVLRCRCLFLQNLHATPHLQVQLRAERQSCITSSMLEPLA